MISDPMMLLKGLLVLAALALPLALGARLLRGRSPGRGTRRLTVQEVLALDTRRRLVLVRCDSREMLLLTGGGQDAFLGWLPEAPER